MYKLTLVSVFCFPAVLPAQETDSVVREQELAEVRIDKDFDNTYRRQLRLLRRTYPMALEAKRMVAELDRELSEIDSKRKKKQYGKATHASLKDDFTFNIKDLYIEEGELLLKLIHRETGMTVAEIIEKYHGKGKRSLYQGMARIWGHSLYVKYDPKGDDWLTEIIIRDIEAGHISFDLSMNAMDKESFKRSKRSYKASRRVAKKNKRKNKRDKN